MQRQVKSLESDVSSIEASISVWMDGEGSAELPQACLGERGRQAWDTYHLIGDVLRSRDLGMPASKAFHARLAQAMETELTIVAAPRHHKPLRWGISSLVAVAAVASVVWVARPDFGAMGGARGADSAMVAENNTGERRVETAQLDDSALSDYLEAHQQIVASEGGIRTASFDTGANQ